MSNKPDEALPTKEQFLAQIEQSKEQREEQRRENGLLLSLFEYFEPKTHRFLAKLLADDIMQKHRFRTPHFKGKPIETLCWDGKMWCPTGDITIHEEVQKRLRAEVNTHRVNEVVQYIRRATYCKFEDFKPPLHLINLANGVYDRITRELLPHDPNLMFTHILPIVYDPTATCPAFDKFLEQVQPDGKYRNLIWEHIGDAFQREIKYRVALLLVGTGKNGKSKFTKIVTALFGPENVARRTIQQLETNRFALADLYDKHLNVFADLPSNPLRDTSPFKTAIAGDPITAERKNQNPFDFEPYAKWFVSTNQVPQTLYDDSDAFHDRFDIIDFSVRFEDKPEDSKLVDPTQTYADPAILDKIITPSEMSGMFNKAMLALDRLLDRGSFCLQRTVEERRELYTRLSNPMQCFVEEELDVTQEDADWIERAELYNRFKEYLAKNHYATTIRDKVFNRQLRDDYSLSQQRIRYCGKRLRVWKGVKWATEPTAEEAELTGQQTLQGGTGP